MRQAYLRLPYRRLCICEIATTRTNSIERAKIAFTAVTGTPALAEIVSDLTRFEVLYKHMPKSKADCNNLEPLGGYREVGGYIISVYLYCNAQKIPTVPDKTNSGPICSPRYQSNAPIPEITKLNFSASSKKLAR